MPPIRMERFGGEIPIVSDRLLPDMAASRAINCDLESGNLRPIQLPLFVRDFSGATTKRVLRMPDVAAPGVPVWLRGVSRNARFFQTPLVNDSFKRVVWIDGNAPNTPVAPLVNSFARIKAGNSGGNAPIQLGVPRPGTAPGLSVAGGVAPTTTRSYVVTFVNLFGEEGQPSDPTTVTGNANGTWNVTQAASVPAGRGITHWNVYRTITGGGGTTLYYRVAQIVIGTTVYADTRLDSTLVFESNTLLSSFWGEPPTLEGMVLMSGGFFAGWKGRDLYFSEPFRPWAWNPAYVLSVPHEIVGCGVHGEALMVLTQGRPSIVLGSRPDSLQLATAENPEPCLTPNSVTATPEGVYFVGARGIGLATAGGIANITRNLISEQEWRASYAAANISIVRLNATQLVALSTAGNGFILDMANERTALQPLANFTPVDSMDVDPFTGDVLVCAGESVWQWAATGAPLTVARWESKEFHFPTPFNIGALKVFFDTSYDSNTPSVVSIITQPPDPVAGGPWTDGRTALVNYFLLNTSLVNEGIVPGTLPPGAPATASPWPFWYGVEPSFIYPLNPVDLDLPSGIPAYIELWGDGVLRWRNYVDCDCMYRPASGFKAQIWKVVVLTRVPIYAIHMAETGKELANA